MKEGDEVPVEPEVWNMIARVSDSCSYDSARGIALTSLGKGEVSKVDTFIGIKRMSHFDADSVARSEVRSSYNIEMAFVL